MNALILAGGRGTRLKEIVSDTPKPMLRVADKPFLEWLLLSLKAQGISRVVLATGYLSHVVEAYFKDGASWGMQIVYSREEAPLGTGGAVRGALDKIETESLVVLNGDSFFRWDFRAMRDFHDEKRACVTMGLYWTEDCSRFGEVELDADGGIRRFQEKNEKKKAGLINGGVYLIRRESLEGFPLGKEFSLERDFFSHLVGQGLYGLVGSGPFLDIGTPESYALASEYLRDSLHRLNRN